MSSTAALLPPKPQRGHSASCSTGRCRVASRQRLGVFEGAHQRAPFPRELPGQVPDRNAGADEPRGVDHRPERRHRHGERQYRRRVAVAHRADVRPRRVDGGLDVPLQVERLAAVGQGFAPRRELEDVPPLDQFGGARSRYPERTVASARPPLASRADMPLSVEDAFESQDPVRADQVVEELRGVHELRPTLCSRYSQARSSLVAPGGKSGCGSNSAPVKDRTSPSVMTAPVRR